MGKSLTDREKWEAHLRWMDSLPLTLTAADEQKAFGHLPMPRIDQPRIARAPQQRHGWR